MLLQTTMISVSLTQALLTLTGSLQQQQRHCHQHHEPSTRRHNMVASSRSSQRRPNLRSDHQPSRSSSPVINDTATSATSPHNNDDRIRNKRVRVASISDREQLQKRRKLENKPNPRPIRIPLRGKIPTPAYTAAAVPTRSIPGAAPALISQESSISNSPLDSPSFRPQYDQFKRIEEKAQRAGQKSITHHALIDEKRKLRSEYGGTRAKTELAQYFPTFDEMLSLDPIDPNSFSSRTHVILVDDTSNFTPAPGRADYFGSQKPLHKITTVDLSKHVSLSVSTHHDPLGPEVYTKAHQKAERHEKQMKNGDKERAQHEKYQLERLLDELRGPDWLKTLGISGITDTEKKRYEPKRMLFIRETKALIEKFKRWREEEKRRKLERQAMLEETEAELGDEDLTVSTSTHKGKSRGGVESRNRSRASSRPISPTDDKGPDSSELDALASQQLLDEAKLANSRRKKSTVPELPLAVAEAEKPFTSFFEKRHMRDAAIGGRQRGRLVLAFGQPMPELDEQEFSLPGTILNNEAIRTSQRNRRRVRRSINE